jgi:hypothetical protein
MPDYNMKVSAATFQQCDGTNFSTAGIDAGVNIGQGNLGAYAGVGTAFTDGSTGLVADVKGSVPYGNSIFSGGFRVRNNINANSQTVQFRFQPATVNVPLNSNMSLYVTPYVATKLDYKTGEADTKVGCFTGLSAKVGKTKIFIEGQVYDVANVNAGTTSVNAGVSIPL